MARRREITYRVTAGGCHECTSHKTRNGYPACGRLVNGKPRPVSIARMLWEEANEPLAGRIIRHTCDNPACINLAHLLPGTHADNRRDAVERDRVAWGERSGQARLTVKAVLAIRSDKISCSTALAAKYGVSASAIIAARTGKTWKRCGGDLINAGYQLGEAVAVDRDDLRRKRKEHGVRLREIAARAGVTVSALSRMENGSRPFRRVVYEAYAAALQSPPVYRTHRHADRPAPEWAAIEVTEGERLRILRLRAGLRQKHIASKAGCSISFVCCVERDYRPATDAILAAYSALAGGAV